MKHVELLTRTPELAQTMYQVKLDASVQIVDRLLLAQRQAAWKTPFPLDFEGDGGDGGDGGGDVTPEPL